MRLSCRGWPGCHLLSLLRQRKKAKKGDREAAALRVPVCANQKMGSERNSLRSDNVHFFIHFLLCTNGSVTAVEHHRQIKFGGSSIAT